MAVRLYLFAMRTRPHVAMAKYMASDHPGNLALWRASDPFTRQMTRVTVAGADSIPVGDGAGAYGILLGNVAEYRRYLTAPDAGGQLDASSWAWADITGWRDRNVTDEEKARGVSPRLAALLGSSSPVPLTQWAHPMDCALAGAWLARARQVTPEEIDGLAPREQHDAILKMFGAFANYWKAINVSVQAWAKYRDAWEYATRTGVGVMLRDTRVYWPRPCASPIAFQEFDPRYTGADLFKRIGPWRTEALLMNNLIAASTGNPHQRKLADVSSLGSGYGLGASQYFSFGNTHAPQPVGSGLWGQPSPGVSPPSTWDWRSVQDGVVSGSTGFGPFYGSHYVWINNSAVMTGGMAHYWQGVTGTDGGRWGLSILCPVDTLNVSLPKAQVRTGVGSQYTPASGWGRYMNLPTPGWRVGYLTQTYDEIAIGGRVVRQPFGSAAEYELEGATFLPGSHVLWQPPPKRYVDLLWPLLEYLATQDPRDIAHEVMLDVLGKNTFTIVASGTGSIESVQTALNTAIGQERRDVLRREAAESAVNNMIRNVAAGTISTLVGLVGTPLAGAAVGAGLSAVFAGLDAADAPQTESNVRAAGAYDVFGRIDSVPSRTGKLLGMIERYAIIPMVGENADNAQLAMYESIRVRSKNEAGQMLWAAGFVTPEDAPIPEGSQRVPWPVGYEFLQAAEPRPRAQPLMIISPDVVATIATVIAENPPQVTRRVRLTAPSGSASSGGPSTAVAVGVAVAAGAAVGLVMASRRARPNPRRRR